MGMKFVAVSTADLKFKKEREDGLRVLPPKDFVPKPFEPWEFQARDLEKLIPMDSSANWNDMGLGKTSTAIWLMTAKKCKKILIVTTKTGKSSYFRDLMHLRPDIKLFNLSAGLEEIPDEDGVYLAHYNLFQYARRKKGESIYARREPNLLCKLLQTIEWDMVILDEAHRIKSMDAQCTKNIKRVKAKYKHVMTGTGFINDPSEVYSLLQFLQPERYNAGGYWGFRNAYCRIINVGGFNKVEGIRRGQEDNFRNMLKGFGVRHTKDEVFEDFPEKYYTQIPVELNDIQKKMYKDIVSNLEALDQAGVPIWTTNVLSEMARLRQISAATPHVVREYWDEKNERRALEVELREPSSKLDALMELLAETDEHIVVFSEWRDIVKLACRRFKDAGVSYIRLRTEDDDETRAAKVTAYQDGRAQVFISTLKLGSEAIDLFRSSTVVFLDRSWSPKDNKQAEDRLHRPGQKNAVQVIDIEAIGTIDNKIKETNRKKNGWFKEIFGSEHWRDQFDTVGTGNSNSTQES